MSTFLILKGLYKFHNQKMIQL